MVAVSGVCRKKGAAYAGAKGPPIGGPYIGAHGGVAQYGRGWP